MAEVTTGKKKVYLSRSKGNASINDKKEEMVGVPPGKFNKKNKQTKATLAENYVGYLTDIDENW